MYSVSQVLMLYTDVFCMGIVHSHICCNKYLIRLHMSEDPCWHMLTPSLMRMTHPKSHS